MLKLGFLLLFAEVMKLKLILHKHLKDSPYYQIFFLAHLILRKFQN